MNSGDGLTSKADFELGLGTGSMRGPKCRETVTKALSIGYRHIDTARQYDNESAIGEALTHSDVDRDSVFLATKVHSKRLQPADVRAEVRESTERLGVETLDLVYVHWPAHTYDPESTLLTLADLQDDGLIGHIGLSNFTPKLVREAEAVVPGRIFAVQAECHPYLQQRQLHDIVDDIDAWLVAHTPLAHGDVLEDPDIQAIADEYGANPAQVALAWLLHRDRIAAIPGTRGAHLRSNMEAKDLELDEEDLARIDAIDRRKRYVSYEFAPWTE
ncbi:aldo/keto reductase [Natronomonas halophila]|uniref:aldo/keto reductase n=1 Tax=Natronomonas halophila TaxID=2747817 RepID=UPI0015B734F7|nr:aldo/keto reductase [Natronomonas halophila]QLD86837.1 aldo/keto reductase [Natronomonas halophila]